MRIGLIYPILFILTLLGIFGMIVDFSLGINTGPLEAHVIAKTSLSGDESSRDSYYVTISGAGNVERIQVEHPVYDTLRVNARVSVYRRTGRFTNMSYGLVIE